MSKKAIDNIDDVIDELEEINDAYVRQVEKLGFETKKKIQEIIDRAKLAEARK